ADDADQAARRPAHSVLERRAKLIQLSFPPDHRRIEPAGERGRAGDNTEQAPCLHRLRLPLQGQRLDGLDQHRVPDEAVRLFADQDLAGARRGLQPLRDRDGLPGRKRLALARISGNDLARVDAGPHSELDAVLGTKLLVEARERFTELGGGPRRAQGVVLAEDRNAKYGHHGISDELLDRASVSLEHSADLDEITRQDPPVGLRVELLAERGRVGQVGEDDRDRLAHLACDGTLREGSATGEAEPGAGGIRLATAGTGGHVPSDSRTEQVAEYTGGRVRRPLRQASDGSPRRAGPRKARRRLDFARDARDPAGP